LALPFGERHALSHTKIVKARALNGGHVEKQIFTCARVDETDTAIG